jgi:hypothetical protein
MVRSRTQTREFFFYITLNIYSNEDFTEIVSYGIQKFWKDTLVQNSAADIYVTVSGNINCAILIGVYLSLSLTAAIINYVK